VTLTRSLEWYLIGQVKARPFLGVKEFTLVVSRTIDSNNSWSTPYR